MRRPLGTELSTEHRSLARRWAIAIPSFYSTVAVIVMIAAALVSSTADKVTAEANSESKGVLRDQSGARPYRAPLYGSLPNLAAACEAQQPCMGLGQTRPSDPAAERVSNGPSSRPLIVRVLIKR